MTVSARDDNGASAVSINACCTRAHSASGLTRISQPFALVNIYLLFRWHFTRVSNLCLQGSFLFLTFFHRYIEQEREGKKHNIMEQNSCSLIHPCKHYTDKDTCQFM